MTEAPATIRSAISQDADGIARIFIESAEYHAGLDPDRYSVPAVDAISARYREARQHPPDLDQKAVTLVAELGGEIVGFVDARLQQSPDPMHREMTYCHVVEIAVSQRHQNQSLGGRLLRAAEDWGRQHGARFASLEYLASNTRASAFYQNMGYHAAAITAIKRL